MTEFGLFNNEGCFYGPCWSMAEAEKELARFIEEEDLDPEEDDVTIREMCQEHDGQPKDGCEECETDDDDDEAAEEFWADVMNHRRSS